MIQDIAPKKLYNEYHPTEPDANDYIAVFYKNKILLKVLKGHMELPKRAQAEDLARWLALPDGQTMPAEEQPHAGTYLFCIDQDSYFLDLEYENCLDKLDSADYDNHLAGPGPAESEYRWVRMSEVRSFTDRELCFAIYTAYHLYRWYRSHRFCGCCSARTLPDAKERMLYCPKCGSQFYPRIAPAVIVGVSNGNKLLLTKYANREYKRYALIAGFTEIGETAEDTVRREVMEEAGVQVKNIRYYKSQPWGIDGNLLFGYFAELDGSDQITMDENELASAEWVSWEKLKDMDDAFSLTREMMRVFYESHLKN